MPAAKIPRRAQHGRQRDRGKVEAARKTLVTERLERSGMRWGRRGGRAILAPRSFVQSRRFDHA